MSKTLQEILAVDNLIAQIQAVVNGIPENILPQGFFAVSESFSGNQGRYTKVSGTQQVATVVNYGARAAERSQWGIGEIPVTLLHTYESISFKPLDLANLLAEDSPQRQKLGRQTVSRNLANFGTLFRNLRISAVHSALATGTIYFDAAGNLLPTSGGAAFGIDFGVKAGHKNQLGGIIAADWDEATTNIPSHVEALQAAAVQATGLPLRNAFYGSGVPGYLLGNNYVGALIKASPALSEQMARGAVIPNGLLGFNWYPATQAFFRDSAGTVRSWFGTDQITFTPEPSAEWWGFLEGGYVIPSSIEIAADALGAMSQFSEVLGPFSYATIGVNPPGITQFSGDTFLPVLTNPDAVWIADVKAT